MCTDDISPVSVQRQRGTDGRVGQRPRRSRAVPVQERTTGGWRSDARDGIGCGQVRGVTLVPNPPLRGAERGNLPKTLSPRPRTGDGDARSLVCRVNSRGQAGVLWPDAKTKAERIKPLGSRGAAKLVTETSHVTSILCDPKPRGKRRCWWRDSNAQGLSSRDVRSLRVCQFRHTSTSPATNPGKP